MDVGGYLQYLMALIFVLGLIGLCAVGLRKLTPGVQARRRSGPGRRLEVLEVLPLDARRRLVMVRRDDAAHLLLIGLNEDRVVETNFAADDPLAGQIVPRGSGDADAENRHGDAPPAPTGFAAVDGGFRRLMDGLARGRGGER